MAAPSLQFNLMQCWVAWQKEAMLYWINYPVHTSVGAAQYQAVKYHVPIEEGQPIELGLYDNYNAAAKACDDDATANP
jgi:hypothetical protein